MVLLPDIQHPSLQLVQFEGRQDVQCFESKGRSVAGCLVLGQLEQQLRRFLVELCLCTTQPPVRKAWCGYQSDLNQQPPL